jgi:hypothetical protein
LVAALSCCWQIAVVPVSSRNKTAMIAFLMTPGLWA